MNYLQRNIQKSQILFVKWEKFGSTAYDQHLKISILNLWMNWGKLGPNLRFTENEMSNLHNITLFTFQT